MRPLYIVGVVLLPIILVLSACGGGLTPPPAPTPPPPQRIYDWDIPSGGLDANFSQRSTPSPTPVATEVPVPQAVPVPASGIERLVCSYDWPCAQALRVMWCESGGEPTAYNPSGASGLFQIMRRYHEDKVIALGYTWDQIFIPEVNVAVAYKIYSGSGWGLWDCEYAAYG